MKNNYENKGNGVVSKIWYNLGNEAIIMYIHKNNALIKPYFL